MDNEEPAVAIQAEDLSFWGQHRYLLLIGFSVVTALILTGVSLYLYFSSGAAQLDLSRPGYSAVAEQATNETKAYPEYSAIGDINTDTVGEFSQLFNEQSAKASAVDAFGGDPLSPEALEISDPKAK